MAAWEEYLDAARRLDTVRQEASAARAVEAAAAQDVGRELAALRQRIGLQRMRLLDVARRAGMTDPEVTDPRVAMQAGTAQPPDAPAAPPASASSHVAAVQAARERLDTADALLSEVDGPGMSAGPLGTWPPARRNAVVYGGFALLVLVVQVILFVAAPSGAASVLAVGCGAVLPVIGFGLAWLGVGIVFSGERVDRTPLLGAVISAAPILVFCTGLLTAAAVH
jgi:hypothetical protein